METTTEEHPWELFPQDSQINRLIIGSFPPNKMVLPVRHKMRYLDGIESVL